MRKPVDRASTTPSLSILPPSLLWFVLFAAPSPSLAAALAVVTSSRDKREATLSPPNPIDLPVAAQVGCIAGAYGLTLLLVALALLLLARKRRKAISAGIEEQAIKKQEASPSDPPAYHQQGPSSPRHVRNFSYPSPKKSDFSPPQTPKPAPYHTVPPSSSSVNLTPYIDPLAEQKEVKESRTMAHEQLADLYKLVMEQEEIKEKEASQKNSPVMDNEGFAEEADAPAQEKAAVKKEKNKPAHLNLQEKPEGEKRKSRGAALLSALRSPRKKGIKGVSISSPLMTPNSGTFSRESQEMYPMSPRHYMPPPPPPVPGQAPLTPAQSPAQSPRDAGTISERLNEHEAPRSPRRVPGTTNGHSIEEVMQADSQSIDGRIRPQDYAPYGGSHSRATSTAEPLSPVSASSQTPLVGLPTSPKANQTRFPSLPSSPKPGVTFSSASSQKVTTAVRTNGTLPLRAFEPSGSPTSSTVQVKQTVFERPNLMSPTSPWTGTAVPYTPYQPNTPCVPMTPSLVTRADRKRMKKLEPKTPTTELVQSSEDIW